MSHSAHALTLSFAIALSTGACGGDDGAAQQCGSQGVWEYTAAQNGCELSWRCEDDLSRRQVCTGPSGGEMSCSCIEGGVTTMTFDQTDACAQPASAIKDACGW